MDLIMCPNGHPNRPGRSRCVVCRAPLPMPPMEVGGSALATTEPTVAPAPPSQTPAPEAAETATDGNTTSSGCGRWAVLLALLLIAAGLVLASLYWPVVRSTGEQTSSVDPEPIRTVGVAFVVTLEPTSMPAAAALPEQTAVSTPMPNPTTAPAAPPTAAPPEATPPTVSEDDTQPLDHDNLILNGDFSERWVDTWLRQVSSNNGVQAAEAVAFDNAPATSGLRLTKTGSGTTRLQQMIDVPRRATELRFVGDVRLVGSLAADGASEGRVALMLTYTDENDESLGHSVWIDDSQPASGLWGISPLPEFGPRLSPRYVEGDGWQTIDIRLQDEFVNRLPGLNTEQVRHVTIDLLALASDTCRPAECAVTLEVANLQLLPTEME